MFPLISKFMESLRNIPIDIPFPDSLSPPEIDDDNQRKLEYKVTELEARAHLFRHQPMRGESWRP